MSEEEQNTESEEQLEEMQVTHVTRNQWFAIAALILLGFYVYLVLPFMSGKEDHLKEPDIYVQDARKHFSNAHSNNVFPKTARMREFLQVVWNYEAAERANAKLTAEDFFRNGLATLEIASYRYKDSRYALVRPIRSFENAKKIILSKRAELIRQGVVGLDLDYTLSDLFEVELDKINFLLGMSYLKAEIYDKSIKHLFDLHNKKHQYEIAFRNRLKNNQDVVNQMNGSFGISPYELQYRELNQADLLLGKAYFKNGDLTKATKAFNSFLESSRKYLMNKKISSTGITMNAEQRYEALSWLGKIQWMLARDLRTELKKKRAAQVPENQLTHLRLKWLSKLKESEKYLNELFLPEYRVYGDLNDQKLMLAEINYFLNNQDKVQELAKDYWPSQRDNKNSMELWRLKSVLSQNIMEPVAPYLLGIAGENTAREIRLAALVILGDAFAKRGELDLALGELIKSDSKTPKNRDKSVYLKAAEKFDEKEFDENPFISKLPLINSVADRVRVARKESDEENAIRLYHYLLRNFTVPKAQVLHHIGYLRRTQAMEIPKTGENKNELTEEARDLYALSAETFLKSLNEPFDSKVYRNTFFEAAESYFLGKWYARAYETYQNFILDRMNDKRISEARYKRGYSALYRKTDTRFDDAKKEFFANILSNQRAADSNLNLPQNNKLRLDKVRLKSSIEGLEKLQKLLNENSEGDEVVADLITDLQKYYDKDRLAEGANLYEKRRDTLLNQYSKYITENDLPLYNQYNFDKVYLINSLKGLIKLQERLVDKEQGDAELDEVIVTIQKRLDEENVVTGISIYESNRVKFLTKYPDDIQARELPRNFKVDLEKVNLNKTLNDFGKGSRDIWAYQSLLELGNVYYASHRYDDAISVYQKIRRDTRFDPRSEIWRQAAYNMAKVTYDKVSESEMNPKPWQSAIGRLEDVLYLYNLEDFKIKFTLKDKVLLDEFKRNNAQIKYLLTKAYLDSNNLESAELHARELNEDRKSYILNKDQVQLAQALYADVLYALEKFPLAMEYYRRAHDRNLDAFERPFYSLNIADCLIGMGRKNEALIHLKRTRWEFENEKVFDENAPILEGDNQIKRGDWIKLVDQRIQSLES